MSQADNQYHSNDNVEDVLLDLLRRRTSIPTAMNTIAQALGNPVSLALSSFEVLWNSDDMPSDSLQAQAVRGILPHFNKPETHIHTRSLAEMDEPLLLSADDPTAISLYSVMLMPVKTFEETRGYFIMVFANRQPVKSDLDRIRLAAKAITTLLRLHRHPDFWPATRPSNALTSLIGDGQAGETALREVANQLGEHRGHYHILLFRFRLALRDNHIPRQAQELILKNLDTSVFRSSLGELVVLTGKRLEIGNPELQALMQKYFLYGGASAEFFLLHQARDAFMQAALAETAATEIRPLVPFDIRIAKHFLEARSDTYPFAQVCHQAVLLLHKYDEQYSSTLLKTLYCYLSNNQSIKETAEALGIHVNTVQQRLTQIERLMGGFSFSLDSFFYLYFCAKYQIRTKALSKPSSE
jgi:hypothetical protein